MKINKETLLLLISITILFLGNCVWIYLNQFPPFYDTAGHTTLAYIYANVFRGQFSLNQGLLSFFQINTYYPPLMHILGGIVTIIFGYNYKILQIASNLFLPLTAFSLYLYIFSTTKNKLVATISVITFIWFPHIWEQSRYYMIDLPLTCFLLFSLYFLEKSEYLKNKKMGLLFFTFAGLAQLTKWYAFLYLIVPFFYSLYLGWSQKEINRKAIYTFLILTFLTIVWVFPWFLINFDELLRQSLLFSQPDFGDPINYWSIENALFYMGLLFNYQIVSIQFLLLLASIYLILKRKVCIPKVFIYQILFIYIIFTFFIGNKNLRYLMPLLPFLSVYFGYAYSVIEKHRRYWGIIYVLFSLIIYIIPSFGFPTQTNYSFTLRIFHFMNHVNLIDFSSDQVPYLYSQEETPQKEIVDFLTQPPDWPPKNVLVVSDQPELSVAGLRVFSLPDMFKTHFVTFFEVTNDKIISLKEREDIEDYLLEYDYFILPNDVVGPIGQINYKNMESIRQYILAGYSRDFIPISTYRLNDNDIAYIFKRDFFENVITIKIKSDKLEITRTFSFAQVYLQLRDLNGEWYQTFMDINEENIEIDLSNTDSIRIDYPARLMRIDIDDGWKWNGELQFDRAKLAVK